MAEDQTTENAEETAGAPQAAKAEPTAPAAEPQEVLAPKERRQRARAAKASKTKARAVRTGEERQTDRVKAKATAHTNVATPPREHVAGVQKVRQGVVVSDKADKTITVRIDTARRHRRYSKVVRTSQTLHAHDESNDAHIGDTVSVREARPLSRLKRWRLVEVVERAR